jgi:hypothetical protein
MHSETLRELVFFILKLVLTVDRFLRSLNSGLQILPVTSSTFIHSNNSKSSYDDTVEFLQNLTKLMKICSEHHSYTAKAQYCFLELFKDEIDTGEILGGNHNVYGRAPNGAENKDKRLRPLNPTKIEYLKNLKSL